MKVAAAGLLRRKHPRAFVRRRAQRALPISGIVHRSKV